MPVRSGTQGKATLREVARLAGVSHTAVSRAVNGLPGLSSDTRDRVMGIVQQIGYKPDPHLGAFFKRVRRTGRGLALLYGRMVSEPLRPASESLDARQRDAIQSQARRAGYHVVLADATHDLTPDGGLSCVADGLADAVIAYCCPSSAVLSVARHVPVVALQYEPSLEGVDCVLTDVCRGVYRQIDHLVALGHRRIAGFVPRSGIWPHRHFQLGYEAACDDRGLERPDAYRVPIQFGNDEHPRAIHAFLDRILTPASAPTAIVTYDVYAPELMRQLMERGLRVPADISIVGFDDAPEFHSHCPVPLTTFRQNFENQAFHALRLLAARTPDATIPAHSVLVAGDLVVRASTAPAPKPAPAG